MNYKLLLSYDGSRYHGWQRLSDHDMTIQGKLEDVLCRMTGSRVDVIGSGRTDAGAHALGQVANFHCQTELSCEQIKDYLQQYLPEDIGILSVSLAEERFHSRYNATSKTYRYRIWNSELPCVFERKYVWKVDEKLNLDRMRAAAEMFVGQHDFLAFCSNKHFKKSSVRTITSFKIERMGSEIIFEVTGDGFLYNMVRIMIGTLVSVGKGEREAKDIQTIMLTRIRENAGITAPAKGLYLVEVLYQ